MAEGGVVKDVKAEVGVNTSIGDESSQQFALLLSGTESNGRPLPVGGFTGQMMSQMLYEITGVVPKEVLVMNGQEVVTVFEEVTPMTKVSQAVHGFFHCGNSPLVVTVCTPVVT